MQLNPLAITVWLFGACIGFLVSQTLVGAVTGLAICLGISLLISFLAR